MPEFKAFSQDEDGNPAPVLPDRLAWLAGVRRNLAALVEDELAHGRAFLAAPVLIGSGAAFWFSLATDPPFPWVLGLMAAFVGLWLLVRHHFVIGPLMAGAALFLCGMGLADVETTRQATILLDRPVTTEISGRVVSVEPNKQGNQRYVIALEGTNRPMLSRMPQQVALLARGKGEPLLPGDGISGRARLSPPSGPALPGLNDFAFASFYDGIGAIGYFYTPPQRIAVTTRAKTLFETASDAFGEATENLRDTISNRIRALVPGDAGAFAVAIVTGERRGLSDQANSDLRVSGLAHIISISGLHMALAGGLCFVGLRRGFSLVPGLAERIATKKIAAAGAILTTTAYFLISGYDVAAQRSYLMMVILLSAALFDRPVFSLRNTAFAALLVICLSPSQVLGPSLQMSFAATFALIAGFDLWRRRPPMPGWLEGIAVPGVLKTFAKAVAASLMTSALGGFSTAIFSAAHFHRFGLHGLEANLMAAPIISMLVMPAGMIGMLLMPLGLDAWAIRLMGWGVQAVLWIGHLVAGWGNGLSFGRFDWWFLPVSTAGLLLLTLLKTRLRLLGVVLMVAAITHEATRPADPEPDLLVSEDGRFVALLERQVTGELIAIVNRRKPPSFLFNQWSSALDIAHSGQPVIVEKQARSEADRKSLPPERAEAEMRNAIVSAKANPTVFYCQLGEFCAMAVRDWLVVTVERRDFLSAACASAGLVIAAVPRPQAGCDTQRPVIDLESLRRGGSMEITLGDADKADFHLKATFSGENRPWIRHRYYDWRSRSFTLPEARQERASDAEDEGNDDDGSL
ncbi:ComEC/Rec2 family competence protein [Allorhizobium undicola]|uniref:ComEC/Rec2 family competence protein n=1 Tax=Allorhizobium undicola TaxID=78527 RepID=UPI000684484E|nr:ComEC/Rec2 family competence protein [Allorhizobium undicola]